MVARTNVQRLDGGEPVTLPPPREGMTREERTSRLELLREARRAAREAQSSGKLVTVPFEVSLLAGSDDALGTPILSGSRVGRVRFVADFGYLNFAGRLFRGMLEVTTDDDGAMIVVNQVDTARYLASVTGAESPSSWNSEALAAQTIAARTYLVTHLRRHGNYDLEGDTRDQEYGGLGTEADSTVRAVERTSGIVATYRGAPIATDLGACRWTAASAALIDRTASLTGQAECPSAVRAIRWAFPFVRDVRISPTFQILVKAHIAGEDHVAIVDRVRPSLELAASPAIGLGAWPTHRRALAPIEHAKLNAAAIGDSPHQPIERIDLAHEMTLAEPADRGIAGHRADGR